MLSLEINQSNAAFGDTGPESDIETARILRELASCVEAGCVDCPIKDINGNTVGMMATTDDRNDD